VDPAQVLPICQLAARVLTVSDLRMACLVSHWKMVWQLRQLSFKLVKDGWVAFTFFNDLHVVLAVRSTDKLYRLKYNSKKARTGLKWACPYTKCLPLPVIAFSFLVALLQTE
jgi:hypothetical protein